MSCPRSHRDLVAELGVDPGVQTPITLHHAGKLILLQANAWHHTQIIALLILSYG